MRRKLHANNPICLFLILAEHKVAWLEEVPDVAEGYPLALVARNVCYLIFYILDELY